MLEPKKRRKKAKERPRGKKSLKHKGGFKRSDAMKPIQRSAYLALIKEFSLYVKAPKTHSLDLILDLCGSWLDSWAQIILDHNLSDIRFYSFWARLSSVKGIKDHWSQFVQYIQNTETWNHYLRCQFVFFLRKKNKRLPSTLSLAKFGFWLNNEWKFYLKDHFRSVVPIWVRQTSGIITESNIITDLIDEQESAPAHDINYSYWKDMHQYLISALHYEYTIPNQTEIFKEVLTKYDNQDKKGIDRSGCNSPGQASRVVDSKEHQAS